MTLAQGGGLVVPVLEMAAHFQPPAADPLKLPRPFRLTFSGGVWWMWGGELHIPQERQARVIGFTSRKAPTFAPGTFHTHTVLHDIWDGKLEPSELHGWYLCMDDGDGPATYEAYRIDRVEPS